MTLISISFTPLVNRQCLVWLSKVRYFWTGFNDPSVQVVFQQSIGSSDTSGGKRPPEVSSLTFYSKQGQLWGSDQVAQGFDQLGLETLPKSTLKQYLWNLRYCLMVLSEHFNWIQMPKKLQWRLRQRKHWVPQPHPCLHPLVVPSSSCIKKLLLREPPEISLTHVPLLPMQQMLGGSSPHWRPGSVRILNCFTEVSVYFFTLIRKSVRATHNDVSTASALFLTQALHPHSLPPPLTMCCHF